MPPKYSQDQNINPEVNETCRAITECLEPSNVKYVYLLAGLNHLISEEMYVQVNNESNSQLGHIHATNLMKSRSCFLSSVQPPFFSPKIIRRNKWQSKLENRHHTGPIILIDILRRDMTRDHSQDLLDFDKTWRQ